MTEPEFESIDSFISFLNDEERKEYTKLEMQKLGLSLKKTDMAISKQLKERGFSIVQQVPVKKVRGFSTSSHDRWYGPGSCNSHGGSGAEQITGFSGKERSQKLPR